MEHVADIPRYSVSDPPADQVVRDRLAGNGIIKLPARRQHTPCKPDPLQLILRQGAGVFHDRVADEITAVVLTIYDQVVRIEMKPVFLGEIGEIVYAHLATNSVTCVEAVFQKGLCGILPMESL